MRRAGLLAATAVAAAAALVAASPAADACCVASPPGAEVVRIADQAILIVWDPTTKQEHFVRQAVFGAGAAKDFGFLVPSPSRPEVAASDASVFDRLRERSRPRRVIVDRARPYVGSGLLWLLEALAPPAGSATGMASAFPKPVEVLERKQVAGYDVAVLAASDAGALAAWLAKNGYDARPALEEWARPYVEKRWIVTAFKYTAQPGKVGTDAVRMSFRSERPYFAYRVPPDQVAPAGAANVLRTYVVAPGRARGQLGEGAAARPWTAGTLRYAKPDHADLERLVGPALPPGALRELGVSTWVTTFDDATWPSGTDDLTFELDTQAEPYVEVEEVPRDVPLLIPGELFIGALVVALVVARRRARSKA